MESSSTLLRLENIRAHRSRHNLNRILSLLLRHPSSADSRNILSILLVPLPALLHLRLLRILLDRTLALLPVERRLGIRRMGLQTTILALR